MCEIPQVMRRLGMAKDEEVWLISKALYGLTTSPRDWSVSRDQKIPQIKWEVDGNYKDCHFEATAEENLWLVKASPIGKEDVKVIGALLVYVDDFLVMGEEKMINPTLQAIAETWSGPFPGPVVWVILLEIMLPGYHRDNHEIRIPL